MTQQGVPRIFHCGPPLWMGIAVERLVTLGLICRGNLSVPAFCFIAGMRLQQGTFCTWRSAEVGRLWIVKQNSCCLANAKFNPWTRLGKFFAPPCSIPHENHKVFQILRLQRAFLPNSLIQQPVWGCAAIDRLRQVFLMCTRHFESDISEFSFRCGGSHLWTLLAFHTWGLCLPLAFLRSLPFPLSDTLHSCLMHDVWTATFCLPIKRQAEDD